MASLAHLHPIVPPFWAQFTTTAVWKGLAFVDFLKATTAAGLVAESGRQLLGLFADRTNLPTPTAGIVKLAVHPQHRPQGVGGRLLDELAIRPRFRGSGHETPSSTSRVYAVRLTFGGCLSFLRWWVLSPRCGVSSSRRSILVGEGGW
jgi:GNAT superfamily N-acetyltransferase